MDGVRNNTNTLTDPFHSGAKTIQFGKYTFLNVTDQLKTGGSTETGTAGPTDQIEIGAGESTGPKYTHKIEMSSDVSDTKAFFKRSCYSDLALKAAAEDLDLPGFTIPDYKAKGLNCYYNFNSAFSNNFCASEQYMTDYDQAPPEGFKWFYQSGGTGEAQKGVEAKCSAIYSPDGKLIWSREPEESKPFDPTDPLSATTWVSLRDAAGKEHRVSADFRYTCTDADLHQLSGLLRFSGEDGTLDAANRFLDSLQVYPKWYSWARIGSIWTAPFKRGSGPSAGSTQHHPLPGCREGVVV